jgi:hypothetical protein
VGYHARLPLIGKLIELALTVERRDWSSIALTGQRANSLSESGAEASNKTCFERGKKGGINMTHAST